MNVTLWACIVRLSFYNDQVRAALRRAGVRETFRSTRPQADTDTPVSVSISSVPGQNETQARANVLAALSDFGVTMDDIDQVRVAALAYFVSA